MNSISSIAGASPASALTGISSTSGILGSNRTIGTGSASFGTVLADALSNVSQQQDQAQAKTREFQAESPNVSLEETMIAMQQSSLSFQAVVQVRNKVVTAYNEMMNMQV